MTLFFGLVLVAGMLGSVPTATVPSAGASPVVPGGVFVTGHDPDFHAIPSHNHVGAQNIIRRAVEFVTGGLASPNVLLVSSAITPPAGHRNSIAGVQTVYPVLDVAGAPDGVNTAAGLLDLTSVDFSAYDVVIVASDYGGILRQAELNILNARSADLINYVNSGGGLVALAESNAGARLTPAGGHFDFLPFLVSEVPVQQNEVGYTVTPFGTLLGLSDSDVNGNASHNVFAGTGGMEIVNVDAEGRILSLATRKRICHAGVPQASVDDVDELEGTGGTTTLTFTVSLSIAPCGADVVVPFSTADATASATSDYGAQSGSLVFGEGETTKTVSLSVVADSTFEPDEFFYLNLGPDVVNGSIADGQGVGTILNDDSSNNAPDCSAVAPDLTELWPPDHTFRTVTLAGATDPEGDSVTLSITRVTQDEATNGLGDGDAAPDAAAGATSGSVQLRAERSGKGDGRVYRISFSGDDGNGGTCSGTVLVGVRHAVPKPPVDSGATFNSFLG